MPWQCPQCKSTDLSVSVTTEARLIQHTEEENFETEAEGDHTWDEHSLMTCSSCSFCTASWQFVAKKLRQEDGMYRARPAKSFYGPGELRLLEAVGITYGFFMDEHGRLMSIHAHDRLNSLRLINRPEMAIPVLMVSQLQPGGKTIAWESPYFSDAKEVLEAANKGSGSIYPFIAAHTLTLPDAIRIAALNYFGKDFATYGSAYLDESSDFMISQAMVHVSSGEARSGSASLAWDWGNLELSESNLLTVPDTDRAETPTMVRFCSVAWITHQGKHYSIDCPDGVADIRELGVFRRAAESAASQGYKIATSRGLLESAPIFA
jgi:hypothetical protein